VIGIAVDDTERLVSQRALRMSEQSYRSLIEEAPHAICRSTATGNLLQVNRAMLEMLGYSEPDMLVRNLRDEVFADSESYDEFLEKLRGRKSLHGFESAWARRDGRVLQVSIGGRLAADSSGKISYVDFIAENISERKQLEGQLRQAQKMQAVGQLAGGIAHDFNNLLTVIRGQAEMMGEHLLCSDPLVARLQEIDRAADRASALTRQLLAFSRGQLLQTKIVDLNQIVSNMSQMLSRLIGANIELDFVPDPDLWQIKVDPGQIEQVIMNLAVNARDAMAGGGTVTIETHNFARELVARNEVEVQPRDYVLLTVRDSGHGMDEAIKSRIFEPFFTTKQIGKGTGLGLSVVYGVVKQSGGHVRVESEPGRGTEFQIYLPRAVGAAAEVQEGTPSSIPRGTETVLFVEDDEAIRDMVAGFLHSHGYRVIIANNGIEAAQLLGNNASVDVLLSDLMMPKMGGRELAARLRENIPSLKVVLTSGNPEDPHSYPDDVHFLPKPFSMHSLAQTLRQVLDGKRSSAASSTS
jgi:PAS domain S-box-containing protein